MARTSPFGVGYLQDVAEQRRVSYEGSIAAFSRDFGHSIDINTNRLDFTRRKVGFGLGFEAAKRQRN